MSVEHLVDAGRAVVFSFCWGEVTRDELVCGLAELRDHPQFGADYRQLVDLSQCSTTELDFNDLCGIHLADDPFSNDARRAIVAPRGGAAFGLARMYQSIVDNTQLEVFDSLTEETASTSVVDSTVARIGGDEFTILVEGLHNPSDGIRISQRIQQKLAAPFEVEGAAVSVSVSVGIAFPENQNHTHEDLLRDAEIAMYRAKQRGRAGCEIFDSAMHVSAIERLQLETDLRRAVELGEFETYYQPILDLSSGRVTSLEALSRWQRPAGITMPAEFIELADATGLILPLNRQLFREACLQLRSWHQQFPSDPPLRISVNLTPRQFAEEGLCGQFRAILQETGVDPRCVDLEITETIAMAEVERSTKLLAECKELGLGISIDDFGTGYSSLSRLKHFSVNTLKIDRSFISGLPRDADAEEIVRAIILLAHNLGLKVVGEGVETEEQEEFLRGLGCDFAQGYLYSRPAKPDMIAHLLAKRGACDTNSQAICSS